ncbi:ATP-dependent helicase [Krasilnikovia sp. M28-CT-15]|uniref:ATP-dependent helicase n=1 Tax=Krasilnikovia sp. M28-CT-15 TaxID=3373540 RepID=UPI003875E589
MSTQATVPAVRRPAYRLVRRPIPAAAPLRHDPLQRRIAAHTSGPLLVVGGPGTGKTTTLVEAVAARVAEGVDPERILVLTFGRRASAALRDCIEARIAQVPGRIVHEPLVRTFHAYAFGLLRRAAAERGEPSPRLLTGPEQDLIIRELLAAVGDEEAPDEVRWPPALRPALPTRAFAQQLRDLMQRAAERGIGAAELARLGERLGRDDWLAAARFLREYVAVLALRDVTTRGSAAYDPAELVRAASGLLADDPTLLAAERRRLAYVYVDELAETDPAQIELLAQVAGGGAPLVAFGDPDSSVYGFRGAAPGVVAEFPDRFRTAAGAAAETVTLHTSYRSAPELLAATGRVARRLRGPIRHRPLFPPSDDAAPGGVVSGAAVPGDPVHGPKLDVAGAGRAALGREPVRAGGAGPERGAVVRTFRSPTAESAYVAHVLREAHLLHGVEWSRMAVLLRSTSLQLPALQRALAAAGVPTVTHAEDLPLHLQPAVAPFLLLLRCALEPGALDEEAAVALLHSPLGGADPLAERRLRQGLRALALAAGDRRPSGDLLLDAVRDPAALDVVDRRWAVPAQNVARLLATAREAAAAPGASAEQVLWSVWQASGLAERWSALSARAAPASPDGSAAAAPTAPRAADPTPGTAGTASVSPGGGGIASTATARVASSGEGERARQWRAAAADRDLDAMVVLFDAAARFSDRLPGARTEIFLDHVLGQDLPADSIAPTGARGDAVRLLTAHAAKGLEWDVVVLAGVQEGIWPDLRLRGSLLGSERLVDVLAGRAVAGAAAVAGQTSALLDEERRLFYVATTRARRRLVVTAVASAGVGGTDGEEQPSRFLTELASPDAPGGDADPPPPDSQSPPDGPSPPGGPPAPDSQSPPDGPPASDGPSAQDGPPVGPLRPTERHSVGSGGSWTESAPIGAENDQDLEGADMLTGLAGAEAARSQDGGDGEPRQRSAPATGHGDAVPMGRAPRALTLAALVAELRTVVVAAGSTPARRQAAAVELARLARAGVPGAHPDQWWGLRPLSDDRPLVDEGRPVKVTPSAMDSALRCSLRWLLERHGGAAPPGPAQGVGNLVHAAAMLAEDANADREKLVEYVAARFDAIELAACWLAGPEQERAQAMVDKLLRWLARNPRRLLAIEHEFTVRLDDPTRPIQLTGRVDRLEVDDDGRLVVIDLKTGKSTAVTASDVDEHAQLAGYQAAVDAGAFADYGSESGGAALVQLGPSKEAREQMQAPLAEADDPDWAYAMVRRTADTMAAATFSAVVNAKCRVCPVRTACPVSGKGRQVVEPPPEAVP